MTLYEHLRRLMNIWLYNAFDLLKDNTRKLWKECYKCDKL